MHEYNYVIVFAYISESVLKQLIFHFSHFFRHIYFRSVYHLNLLSLRALKNLASPLGGDDEMMHVTNHKIVIEPCSIGRQVASIPVTSAHIS